jgi:hypothetical protein
MDVKLPFAEKLSNCGGYDENTHEFQAALIVSGGYSPCSLNVQSSLSVTGQCSGIVTGQVRFLFIYYTVALNEGGELQEEKALAYDVSYVDLTSNGLETAQTVKTVNIAGSQSETYYADSDAELDSIDCSPSSSLMDQAKCWVPENAIVDLQNGLETLDSDGDETNNLKEFCAGTLFEVGEGEGESEGEDETGGA